ncbi:MAG: anaerobic ribonucleoside-triphosphate reductase activating protein [Desulfuromonas sp.]|nr:MAG: anaerobic ribonucleoside-triphosphate reductase activating protein [Desulfuromonas sp.]
MKVKGFQGTSLLDFPGRVASLIFFGGCNLTCPFCHNPSLVLDPDQYPDYPREVLLEELKNRMPFIDGVVVSGGEPTIDPQCINLLREIKALGLAVKLDTNGLRPEMLQRMLDENLLDYLAFDLKTAPGRYGELHTSPVDLDQLQRSISIIMKCNIDYEFRTTCVPAFVDEQVVRQMGAAINGAERWAFQQFMPEHSLDAELREAAAYPDKMIRNFAEIGKEYAREVLLRGV